MLFLLFRLVKCNIVLMKRFLPLLMLTGLLFGQDVLLHKSGENYKGTFIGKVDEDIVFQIEGRSSTNKFPINDVDIVITSREGIKVELYYPFDTSTKKDNPSFGQDILNLKSGESFEGTFHEKLGRDILFKAVGDTTTKKFPIWDIETIVTKNWGVLTYPFDVPISSTYKNPKNTWDFEGNSVSQSSTWSWSRSIGYSSEKIPISFYNYSLLYDNDEHSELFGTFTSIIFVSGIGLGYKYYIMGKSKSSMFISICALNYFADDFSSGIFGFSTAAGVSLRRIGGKTSFNIGISRGSLNHPEYPILPFINLEKRW